MINLNQVNIDKNPHSKKMTISSKIYVIIFFLDHLHHHYHCTHLLKAQFYKPLQIYSFHLSHVNFCF